MTSKTALKIGIGQINPILGALKDNADKMIEIIQRYAACDLVVFPELALCGYPPEDLVLNHDFLVQCEVVLDSIVAASKPLKTKILFGAPHRAGNAVYNSAFIVCGGKIEGIYHKVERPNYGVFDEKRVFGAGQEVGRIIEVNGVRLGLAICEDIWFAGTARAAKRNGAQALISLNASPWRKGVNAERQVAFDVWSDTELPHLFVNMVGGQDDLVFDGASFFMNPDAKVPTYIGPSFAETVTHLGFSVENSFHPVDGGQYPPVPPQEALYSAAVIGLRDYVSKNGFKGVLLGLSGGIDSAICAAIAVDALGAERVRTVMMPYHYTAQSSVSDAKACAQALGVTHDVIPIAFAKEGMDAILAGHKNEGHWGLAEENMQSRLRGLVLMSLSNATGDMVITTGNKSEIAVGYATLYGDMCGGYNPIKDMWKTEVFALAAWRNLRKPAIGLGPDGVIIPEAIIKKPPSAELRPDQKDTDTLPDYDVLDQVLRHLVELETPYADILAQGFAPELVQRIASLLDRAEYKRRQSAPGPKLGPRDFSRGRRYPITNRFSYV